MNHWGPTPWATFPSKSPVAFKITSNSISFEKRSTKKVARKHPQEREATRPVVLRCEGWSRLRAGCGALSPAVELDLVAAAQAQRLHGEPATAADNNYIRRSLNAACSELACFIFYSFLKSLGLSLLEPVLSWPWWSATSSICCRPVVRRSFS